MSAFRAVEDGPPPGFEYRGPSSKQQRSVPLPPGFEDELVSRQPSRGREGFGQVPCGSSRTPGPPSAGYGGPGISGPYGSSRSSGSTAPAASRAQHSAPAALGGARGFQRALSSSLPDAGGSRQRHAPCPSSSSSVMPDYGDYNSDNDDYGSTSRPSSRNQTSSRSRTSSSSTSQHRAGPNRQLDRRPVAQQEPSSKDPGGRLRKEGGSPLRPQQHSPCRADGVRALGAPGAGPSRSSSQTAAVVEPDYGDLGDDGLEYGAPPRSSTVEKRRRQKPRGLDGEAAPAEGRTRRRVRRPKGGSSSAAAAAASAALAGSKAGGGRGRSFGDGGGQEGRGGSRLDPARQAALEAELAALRAALEESETRQAEASLVVMSLESDRSTMQSQLEQLRRQKQQLEMALIMGEMPGIPGAPPGGSVGSIQEEDEYEDGSQYTDEYEDEEEGEEGENSSSSGRSSESTGPPEAVGEPPAAAPAAVGKVSDGGADTAGGAEVAESPETGGECGVEARAATTKPITKSSSSVLDPELEEMLNKLGV